MGLSDTSPCSFPPSPVPQLTVPWPAGIRQASALHVFCWRGRTLTGVALAHLVVQQENKPGEKKTRTKNAASAQGSAAPGLCFPFPLAEELAEAKMGKGLVSMSLMGTQGYQGSLVGRRMVGSCLGRWEDELWVLPLPLPPPCMLRRDQCSGTVPPCNCFLVTCTLNSTG